MDHDAREDEFVYRVERPLNGGASEAGTVRSLRIPVHAVVGSNEKKKVGGLR
jgi:hypothetical protein